MRKTLQDKNDPNKKETVETWKKNIGSLASEFQKQAKFMEGLDEDVDDAGVGSTGEIKRDYFKLLYVKLGKEVIHLVEVAKMVIEIDVKKTLSDSDRADAWDTICNQLSNEADKAFSMMNDANADRFYLLSKVLNMRENLLKQIFHAIMYKKLITWKDLQIDPDEYATQAEVDTLKLFSSVEEQLSYLPTRMEYNTVTFEAPAYFS